MKPAAKRAGDDVLRALPPHLTRPPKHKRRSNHPRSRPNSPLSLPPMSSPDPEKDQDPDIGTAGVQVVIETKVTSVEDIPPDTSPLEKQVSTLEDKIDDMQTRMSALEKELEDLKERLASLSDRLVALEKVAQTTAPSLQSFIVDEAHKLIFASQTMLLAYINTYVLGPVQKLKF